MSVNAILSTGQGQGQVTKRHSIKRSHFGHVIHVVAAGSSQANIPAVAPVENACNVYASTRSVYLYTQSRGHAVTQVLPKTENKTQ